MKAHPFTMLAVLGALFAAGYGWVEYARASDVDDKIAALETKVDANGTAINRVLTLQLAESIRSQQRQICATASALQRQQLQTTLDNLLEDYEDVSGRTFQTPTCAALQVTPPANTP